MQMLKVKNFGPVKNGYPLNDGFFEIKKLTLFIGDQGTGKSTVAKLFSTFLWLEKALFRGDYEETLSTQDFISLCKQQQISSDYFTSQTEIEYKNDVYNFSYVNNAFKIQKNQKFNHYIRPKIMYYPAERNILSVIQNADEINNIPAMLSVLSNRYENAKKYFLDKSFNLPLKNYFIQIDNNTNQVYVLDGDENSKVLIAYSSSGIQSVTPLALTQEYLSNLVNADILEKLVSIKSVKMQKLLLNELENNQNEILAEKLQKFFVSGIKSSFLDKEKEVLTTQFNKFFNFCYASIIEEPELNLFPISQKTVTESAVKCLNANSQNSLFITTHSPYILGALNNCIYAANLTQKGKNCTSVLAKGNQISIENVSGYKIQNGEIFSIVDNELSLIKNSEIDECSDIINEQYNALEEIELS